MARHATEYQPHPALDKFILLNPHAEDHQPPFVKIFDVETLEYFNAIPTEDQHKMVEIIKAWPAHVFDQHNMVQYTWYRKNNCKRIFSIGPGLRPNEISIHNLVKVDYSVKIPGLRIQEPQALIRIIE